jgi:hypothetical protein
MVAGIHPTEGYDYYLDVVRAAKRARPDIHVKAFTMVEIDHMLKISGKSEEEVFQDLRDAGLGSCPGGGAEVLVDRVHKATFRDKIGPQAWLDTARKVQQQRLQDERHDALRPHRAPRSASSTWSSCASCRTSAATSWPTSRSRSGPSTPASSGTAT